MLLPLRRIALCLAVLVFFLPLQGPPASAQDEARATVRVDGRTVFRVGATGEMSPSERARQIERRLTTLLETPQAIVQARVEATSDGARVISMAGVPVVTLTQSDADDNVVDLDPLASQWAASVNRVMLRARDQRTTAWGRFTSDVQGSVQTAFARLIESSVRIIPRFLAALVVIAVFWAIAAALRWAMRGIFRRVVDDLTVENLIKQFTYYSVWTLGLIVAVDALGFDPQTVVTGLGLTGLALGFALKDIISNFVSGILILTLRPFRLGDQIIVGETEGAVERIQLRATEIRTYDGRLVLVPNAEVFTSRVTNNTESPVRRGNVEIYLGYEVDLQRVSSVVRNATQAAPGVLADPPATVRISELEQDDVRMEARYWTDSRRTDYLDTASAVRTAVVVALKEAGIGLPDPDVRYVVRRDDSDGGFARRAAAE